MLAKNQLIQNRIDKKVFNSHRLKQDGRQRPRRRLLTLNLMTALLIAATLCMGCGGSSSSGSSGVTVSGTVADGYLSGARVFLDLNNNRLWDADEPYGTSGADGSYTISNISAGDDSSYPVVAEATLATTDLDTGKPVRHPYALVSPAGHPGFISPLTTMVQVSYECNPGITLDQALAAVKALLSIQDASDVDLLADYVKEEADADASAADYTRLHRIAQLSARLMGANISTIKTAADNAGVALDEARDEILRMAVKTIMQNMSLIDEATDAETDFDADQQVQILDIAVNTDNIAADIAAEAMAVQYQAPSLRWAAVFRSHDTSGNTDFLCLGLEQDLDLTGYTFSAEGPGGAEYIFADEDLYTDQSAPIAWAKYISDLPAGEYRFYVTVPGGEKVELARDTHVHTVIPAMSLASAQVVRLNGPLSQVYHDTLDGTYYYRMMIRDSATDEIVYQTRRRERNFQAFPNTPPPVTSTGWRPGTAPGFKTPRRDTVRPGRTSTHPARQPTHMRRSTKAIAAFATWRIAPSAIAWFYRSASPIRTISTH